MTRKTFFRFGVTSAVLGGSAIAASIGACGGDDTGPAAQPDSGRADSFLPPPDSSDQNVSDASDGGGGDSAPKPKDAKLVIVHASPDMPMLRFCFGFGAPDAGSGVSTAPLPPAPNHAAPGLPFPGTPPGTGGPAADYADLSKSTISAYVIDAAKIANVVQPTDGGSEPDCIALLGKNAEGAADGGTGTLTAGTDFWYVGTIPSGTLLKGTSWMVALTGCRAGETVGAGACPQPYNTSTGNLGIQLWQLDRTTVIDGGSIGAQFVHASSAFENVTTVGGAAQTAAGFYVPGADGGVTFAPIVVDAKYGQMKPAASTPVSGVTFDGTSGFFAQAIAADAGTVGRPVAYPLPVIQQLSWGQAGPPDGAALANGQGFTFVLVGDPLQPAFLDDAGNPADSGTFNTRFIHFLAFPNDPPFGTP